MYSDGKTILKYIIGNIGFKQYNLGVITSTVRSLCFPFSFVLILIKCLKLTALISVVTRVSPDNTVRCISLIVLIDCNRQLLMKWPITYRAFGPYSFLQGI